MITYRDNYLFKFCF